MFQVRENHDILMIKCYITKKHFHYILVSSFLSLFYPLVNYLLVFLNLYKPILCTKQLKKYKKTNNHFAHHFFRTGTA